jgi:hypothetical protein
MIAHPSVDPRRVSASPKQNAATTNPRSNSHRTSEWILWAAMVGIGTFLFSQFPNPTPVFANPRLLVIHLMAVIPLAIHIASTLNVQPRVARWLSVVPVLFIATLEFALPWLSNQLIPMHLGLSARWIVRTCIAILIMLPWAISAPIQSRSIASQRWVLALILACTPTFIYSWHQLDLLTKNFSQIDSLRSPKKGMLLLQQILEIDDTSVLSEKPSKQLLLELMQTTDRLEHECASPLLQVSDSARLDRAAKLLSLDRHREANELIQQTDEREPSAKILKILCALDSENWIAVHRLCSDALSDTTGFSELERMRLHSWNAEALARQKRFEECIQSYRIAAADCPDFATPFRIDMALQLAESGNVSEAIETLKNMQRTIDLKSNPSVLKSIQTILVRIQNNSCSLRKSP